MRKIKGSFTVEAALVLPIALFCILMVLEEGLELYNKTVETARKQEMWSGFYPAETFRRWKWSADMMEQAEDMLKK